MDGVSQQQNPRPSSRFPRVPDGDVVASYASYEDAKSAVDRLVHSEGFAVRSVSIVGSDLRSIERVTGRMSFWRAAASGALSGLLLGLFFGAMMLLLDPMSNLAMLVGIALLGAVFGAIWGLIVYAISPDKREFTSMMQVTASRYDLIVPREMAGQVRQILGNAVGASPSPPPARLARGAAGDAGAGMPGAGAPGAGAPHTGGWGQAGQAGQGQPGQPGRPGWALRHRRARCI